MDLDHIKSVYCVGIGGIGVSAVARFFNMRGVLVRGSDIEESEEISALRSEGIEVVVEGQRGGIPPDTDALIYSPAVPEEDMERTDARRQGVAEYSYPQVLGVLLRHYSGIAVSGTNGKTSTTALLGEMLAHGGKDPHVIVGGKVSGWRSNYRHGGGDIFVVEACEYRRNMLNLYPHVIVLTNIEADHLDYYKDIDDIKDAFTEYITHLDTDDVLICNYDDKNIRTITEYAPSRMIRIGIERDDVDVRASNIRSEGGKNIFSVSVWGEDMGEFITTMPGVFNIYNILCAMAVSLDIGVSVESIRETLSAYKGSWRRFEHVGDIGGVPVISDYAHHPTSVRQTIQAAKEVFPGKRLLVVFRPHQKDRTIKLYNDFVQSFAGADEVVIIEIYEVFGREKVSLRISSKDLVRDVSERGGVDSAVYARDLHTAEQYIRRRLSDAGVVLIMGAGDVDDLARTLVRENVT